MRDILEYLKKEWGALTKAPFSFIGLASVLLIGGIALGQWHYSELLNEKDGQIGRYRVALGIDPGSAGALVELDNQELALRAKSITQLLREFQSALTLKPDEIQKRKGQRYRSGNRT
jgi:hypothetical protein